MPHGSNGMTGQQLDFPPAPGEASALLGHSILPDDFAPPVLVPPRLAPPGAPRGAPRRGPQGGAPRAPERGPSGPMFGAPPGGLSYPGAGPMYQQAVGVIPQQKAHTLGLSVIGLGIGAAVGIKYGGLYGGVAGGLFGGALVNAYRAVQYGKEGSEDDDKEAMVSGTYAVISGALGAILWTKYAKTNSAIPNPSEDDEADDGDDDDDDDDAVAGGGPCGIRPVGP